MRIKGNCPREDEKRRLRKTSEGSKNRKDN
jgi:hypothetical protein